MSADDRPKRWKPRLTWRASLLLIVAIVLAFGWWIGLQVHRVREQAKFEAQFVVPAAFQWKKAEVREAWFPDIVDKPKATDKDISRLSGQSSILVLSISGAPNVTDVSMETIGELRSLVHLRLMDVGISDAGLTHVKSLPALRSMELRCRNVGNAGLRHLRALPSAQRADV